jgi:hypothetical protein
MRKLGLVFLVLAVMAVAQAPSFQNVGTMSQLMIDIIYPTSDAIFYVERTPPKAEVDWEMLASQALMLAESGNLLMMPGRARDQGDWIKYSKTMQDIGATAFKAARNKDLPAIVALNQGLNDVCVACHMQYRSNYRKKKQ